MKLKTLNNGQAYDCKFIDSDNLLGRTVYVKIGSIFCQRCKNNLYHNDFYIICEKYNEEDRIKKLESL